MSNVAAVGNGAKGGTHRCSAGVGLSSRVSRVPVCVMMLVFSACVDGMMGHAHVASDEAVLVMK